MASSKPSLDELFSACRADVPASAPLSAESWYLVAASALVTAGDPSLIAALYKHVVSLPEPLAKEQRREVNRRLREFLLKQWITVGVGKMAVATWSLTQAEEPGDADLNQQKKYKTLDASMRDRGNAFLDALFTPEMKAHILGGQTPDVDWLTRDVVYGLFYADDGVLGFLETELLTYTALTCQAGMHLPRSYHIGGLKRMGLGVKEVEGITRCAERVAQWCGQDTSSWQSVADAISWE